MSTADTGTTDLRELIDVKLQVATGTTLADTLVELADGGMGYRRIANEVSERAGRKVSHETIRRWLSETPGLPGEPAPPSTSAIRRGPSPNGGAGSPEGLDSGVNRWELATVLLLAFIVGLMVWAATGGVAG